MTAAIHPFEPGCEPPAERKPNPALISALQGLIDRAKTGDLQALAYATIDRDCNGSTGWSSTIVDNARLIGWVSTLQYRMNSSKEREA